MIIKNNPLVSIIIPVYNVDKYINKCIDSVITQSYKNVEIILVDDGSIDNSGTICDEYANIDKRIIVLHKQNEGVAKARIDGFNLSKGEFIAFIDADDYVDKEYISHLYNCIRNYNVDLVGCQYYFCKKESNNVFERKIKGFYVQNDLKALLQNSGLCDIHTQKAEIAPFLWAKLIKRDFVLKTLHKGIGLTLGEDHAIVLSMLQIIQAIFISPEAHYYYVQHEGQATRKERYELFCAEIKFWEKIIEIDKEHLYDNQLRYKSFRYISGYINNIIKSNKGYTHYKKETCKILDLEKTQFFLSFIEKNNWTYKQRLLLYLLKNRRLFLVWLYYWSSNLRIKLYDFVHFK